MSESHWAQLAHLLWPHIAAVSLCAARLLPVAFLCPVLGGPSAPMTVRLGLVLALSLGLHVAGGVAAPPIRDAFTLVFLVVKEGLLGVVIGLIASLPFEVARMGGRFIDLLRGTSAEAALPGVGSREAVTGEGLYHLLVALTVTGAAFPLILGALWRSFGVIGLGVGGVGELVGLQLASLVVGALATALALAAPVAALALGLDLLAGVLSKAVSPVGFQELSGPTKILGGGLLLWLGLGLLAERLLAGVADAPALLRSLLEAAQ